MFFSRVQILLREYGILRHFLKTFDPLKSSGTSPWQSYNITLTECLQTKPALTKENP